MEEHIKYKMMFTGLFISLAVLVVVVFAVAIKVDREAPPPEAVDIDALDEQIYREYERGEGSNEVVDEYTEENGISFLNDRAVITFKKDTTQKKALTILSDFAEAYEYNKEDNTYEILLKKEYDYESLTKYCETIVSSYIQITKCDLITK
jgi:hypothetical protein